MEIGGAVLSAAICQNLDNRLSELVGESYNMPQITVSKWGKNMQQEKPSKKTQCRQV